MSFEVARLRQAICVMAEKADECKEPVLVFHSSDDDDVLHLASVVIDAGKLVLRCSTADGEDGKKKDLVVLDGDKFSVAKDGSAIEITDTFGETFLLRFGHEEHRAGGKPLIDADCPKCRAGQMVSHLANGESHFCEVCESALVVKRTGSRVQLVR